MVNWLMNGDDFLSYKSIVCSSCPSPGAHAHSWSSRPKVHSGSSGPKKWLFVKARTDNMLVYLLASNLRRCLGDQFHSSHRSLRLNGIQWKSKWFGIAFINLFNIRLALNEWFVDLELNFDPVPAAIIPSQKGQLLHPDALQHIVSEDLVGLLPCFHDLVH